MVSKARLDLPDPESPVMQIRAFRGSATVMSLRLCSRAPWTTSSSDAMPRTFYRRTDVRPDGGRAAPSGLAPAAEHEPAQRESQTEGAGGEAADGDALAPRRQPLPAS